MVSNCAQIISFRCFKSIDFVAKTEFFQMLHMESRRPFSGAAFAYLSTQRSLRKSRTICDGAPSCCRMILFLISIKTQDCFTTTSSQYLQRNVALSLKNCKFCPDCNSRRIQLLLSYLISTHRYVYLYYRLT